MFLRASVLTVGVIVGVAGAMWADLAASDRAVIAGLWTSLGGYVVITVAYLLVLIGFATNWGDEMGIHALHHAADHGGNLSGDDSVVVGTRHPYLG